MICKKSYILLSGGQDSFVSLLWARDNFKEAEAVTVNYNQTHNKEIEYARNICQKLSVRHTVYDINDFFQKLTTSSLLSKKDHNLNHETNKELPASFVPNRNGILLTIIATHAYNQKPDEIHLVTGVCQTDYSGYPDCRNEFIRAKEKELSLGLDKPVVIHTPLMWKDKAETFKMAYDHGRLDDLNSLTLTCYNGIEDLHDWGRGCGECPACKLRKNGFIIFKEKYLS